MVFKEIQEIPKVNFFVVNEWALEAIALGDFVADAFITIKLMNSRNTMWASLTVCAIVAPPLVSSFQMIKFLRNKVINRNREAANRTLFFISGISITPIYLVFLIIMDTYFVLN